MNAESGFEEVLIIFFFFQILEVFTASQQPYEQRCVCYTLFLMQMSFDHIFSRLNMPGALNDVNSNRTGYEASNDDLNDDMKSV